MNKKIVFLLVIIVVAIAAVIIGIYFLGKANNRTVSQTKVTVASQMNNYSLQFHVTTAFADFLYSRSFWNTNAIRIDKKKPPLTVKSISIKLKDSNSYKGTSGATLPVIASSKVDRSTDGTANTYYLDIFLNTSRVKKYSDKELDASVFLAILSQIYEDTSRSTTSYEARQAKYAQIGKVAGTAGANPLTIKRVN